MNKFFNYILCSALAISLFSCNNESEDDLLESKVYFESTKIKIDATDEGLTYDLQSRLSTQSSSDVTVNYVVGDANDVEAFNKLNITEYVALDASFVKLSASSVTITAGNVYSSPIKVSVDASANIEEGKTYVIPIKIQSSSLPTINRSDIAYLLISKPVQITTVGNFGASYRGSYIKIPVSATVPFTSLTYEALINIETLGSNNTIMGTEGILILRIGDPALPDGHNDWLQIAGNKQFHSTKAFVTNQWYHVAFTYDQPSGKAILYINGEKVSESSWDTPSFNLANGGCYVGKVKDFMWGERPFYGCMSEVRLWNVARTADQIKNNMLSVDPKSEGLAAYYKLNGKDLMVKNGTSHIKDASGHGMDGETDLKFKDLDKPVEIK